MVQPIEVAEAATLVPNGELNRDDLIAYATQTAIDNGLNAHLFVSVIRCESDFDPLVEGDNHTSFGIAQFHGEEYRDKAFDPIWSIDEMAREWKLHHESRWSCYTKLTRYTSR